MLVIRKYHRKINATMARTYVETANTISLGLLVLMDNDFRKDISEYNLTGFLASEIVYLTGIVAPPTLI